MAGQELEKRAPAAAPAMNALMPARPIDELARIAKAMAKSNLYDILQKSRSLEEATSKAFVILLAGQELGIGTSASMANIYVIDGKPTFGAHLMGALVKRHPKYDYRKVKRTEEEAVIEWFELSPQLDADGFQKKVPLGTSEFTMKDATIAGLHQKTNWKKSPKDMLWARAMTQGVRMNAPDVFNGPIYTPDEIEAGEANIEIGQVMVEREPITEDMPDGKVVDKRTGEVIFDPATDDRVEGEVIPPDSVEKASETPADGETITDAEVVGETPAASEEPSAGPTRSESGGGGSSTASPPRSGRRTGSRRPTPTGTSEVSASGDAAPAVLNEKQLKMLQARRVGALLGEENDDLWRIVLKAVAGVDSAKDVPSGKVAEMVKTLNMLEGLVLNTKMAEWQEWLESAGRSIGVELDLGDDGAET